MSIFGDDGMSGMLQDDLNENINGDELPGASDGEENPDGDDGENKVAVKVEPKTRRAILNPRPRITVELLKGERGLQTIENHFKDMKFLGKGHENSDLNEVMRRLQHWGHRLCPNFKFDDILLNIERLSKKKPLQIHMNNYRQDLLQPITSNAEVQDADNDEANAIDEPFDEFDALISEQIAISKLTSAPQTPRSVWSDYSVNTNAFTTPKLAQGNAAASTPYQFDSPGPSSPQPAELPEPDEPQPKLSSELMAKIAENRRLAQERLRAKAEAANAELFS